MDELSQELKQQISESISNMHLELIR